MLDRFKFAIGVRDKNPAFFKNQRIFHSAPKPLFKNRNHTLDFVTDLPSDSIESATLYFKTDSMSYFREFELKGTFGVYISPQVTTNVKLSATFGGWQNANPTGASP